MRMAGSKEIRTKIKSVQNTRKITKAMEMVAASKMRKAQDRMRHARPYADKVRNIAAHLADANPEYRHPYLVPRESVKTAGVIVVTTDKGLCGGLNTNVLRAVTHKLRELERTGVAVQATAIGNKGFGFLQRIGAKIVSHVVQLGDTPHLEKLIGPVKIQLDAYAAGEIDAVYGGYPGERLLACRNPQLAKLRAFKREDLLRATEKSLQAIKARVDAGRLKGADAIGLRVGKAINQYKVARHFELTIEEDSFTFERKHGAIAAEAALDGIYIIRTSVEAERMDAPECVRSYKALANVERAFRSLKTVDLKVRPIHHRTADRVRAHIFLCMLAYYVEWHMREAWRELMFADTDLGTKASRDPVAPARRSKTALAKAASHVLDDGTPVHSFSTLMAEMGTVVRNTCRTPSAGAHAPTFDLVTTANDKQKRALELIRNIEP